MAELYRSNIVDVDLSKPLITEQRCVIATKDSNANVIGVNVFDDGSEVDLTGCTVIGYFTRQDGHVEKLIGGVSGNRAIVILNANCYTLEGRFTLVIKVKNDSGLNLTVRIVNGFAYPAMPDDAEDEDIPSAVVTLYVDDEGNAIITGAVATVEEGEMTL